MISLFVTDSLICTSAEDLREADRIVTKNNMDLHLSRL